MSSANIKSLALWSTEKVEFMNRENSKGNNKTPWRIPDVRENKVEEVPRTEAKIREPISKI